jgi:glycosyltransferase involved in cell wall biosynthesis
VRDLWPLSVIELGNMSPKSLFIRFLSYLEKIAYKHSDLVISVLSNAKEYMVTQGLEAKKFLCVPNGIDLKLLSTRKKVPTNIIKQLDTSKFIIGYAGALGIANNLYALIDAAELLKDKEGIEFVLLGGGSEETKLKEYANKKKLNNIIFPGSVAREEVHNTLEYFDVCYLGLQKSALFQYGVSPTKLYDYMAVSKPILYAIDSGNHPVKDANCGIEVNSGNPKDIADAILKFYKMDEKQRRQLGINGYDTLVDNYTFDKLTEKIIENLETL